MNKKTLPLVTIAAAASLLLGVAGATSPAFAADQTPSGVVIAQGSTESTNTIAPRLTLAATPTKSGEITVSATPRSKVTMTADKTRTTRTANAAGSAVFTNLTPGKEYTFTANKKSVRARALTTTAPVTNVTVLTTTTPDSVAVSWNHVSSPKTGGADTIYTITATPQGDQLKQITQTTKNTAVVLTGLDPNAIYTFTVTPSNALGAGVSTSATMSAPLKSLMPRSEPVAQEAKKAPAAQTQTQTQNQTPAAQPIVPGTRTIYVCPSTFTEVNGTCQKTAAYTYTYQLYTYHPVTTNLPYTNHTVQTGPAPIIDSFETQSTCPSGYNLEDYGAQGKWCRLYGAAPTAQVKDAAPAGFTDNGTNYTKTEQVKDATPAGFTDNGTQWVKKDAAPAGYTDNGVEYMATANKIAQVVPA